MASDTHKMNHCKCIIYSDLQLQFCVRKSFSSAPFRLCPELFYNCAK